MRPIPLTIVPGTTPAVAFALKRREIFGAVGPTIVSWYTRR